DTPEVLLDLDHAANRVRWRVPVPQGAGTWQALLPVGRRVPAPTRWRCATARDHGRRTRSPVGRRPPGPDAGRWRVAPVLRTWLATRPAIGAAACALLPQGRLVRWL